MPQHSSLQQMSCESTTLKEKLAKQGVDWKFIPKRAPWYGGFWERLIGLTKTTLKKVLGRTSINLATLQTIIVEIEAMLNDRPLTFVSSDLDDEPLTPSHLLYGRRITSLPNQYSKDEVHDTTWYGNNTTQLQKEGTRMAMLIDHFWKR